MLVCTGVGGTVAVTVDVAGGVEMSTVVEIVGFTVVLEKVVVGLLSTVVVPPFTAVLCADTTVARVNNTAGKVSFIGQRKTGTYDL